MLNLGEQHPPPQTRPKLHNPTRLVNWHRHTLSWQTLQHQPELGRVQSTSRVAIVRRGQEARLWTRNRNDITDRFPEVAAAAIRQLPDGVVLDGEPVILGADGRLSFDALQQRLVTGPARGRAKAAELPASYAAFDLLAVSGVDLCG